MVPQIIHDDQICEDCNKYEGVMVALLNDLGTWISDHATVLSTVVTAIATGTIAWFTINLAKATIEQGKFAEKALMVARRPFVFVEDFRSFFELSPTTKQPKDPTQPRIVDKWAFRPVWRNNGETQTKSLFTHVDYEYRESPLPLGYKFPDNHPMKMPMLLGPKSIGTGGCPRSFTVEEIEKINKQERFLYMWGWLKYEDGFQSERPHLTRYCVQVVVVGDPKKSDCTFQWLVHPEGNCSDEECGTQGLG